MTDARSDLAKITFGVLSIGLLIASALWILRPFLGATIWAAMLVVATWPAFLWIQARLWKRRSLAVLVMVVILLLLFVLPLTLAITTIASNAEEVVNWVRMLISQGPPTLPGWVQRLPLVGARLTQAWSELVAAGVSGLEAQVTPYIRQVTSFVLAQAGVLGALTLQFLLTVVIAGMMYAGGESAAAVVRRFGFKLGGQRGEDAVVLAGKAIRGVALGVVVTALVQSVLAGLALWLCGIPAPGVLAALVFVLGIAQLGPLPVMLPAIAWLYWTDQAVWGTVLLVLAIPIGALDNVLRPILIRRGVQLPMLLIIAGVIGGLIAFGVMGLFVGPVILAASYTLVKSWVAEGGPPPAQPGMTTT